MSSSDENPEPVISLSARTVKGAGWVIGWRFITRNLGLLSTLVLVRLLSPLDFGLVALATGFIATVDALSAFGPQDVLIREPSPSRGLYDTAFTLNLLRGIVTAAIVAGCAWPVADFFAEPRLAPVLLALSVGALASAFENIGIVDFRRELAFHREFQLQVIARVFGVMLTVAFAVAWHDYWSIIIGIMATALLRLALSYTMSPYRPGLRLRSWRRIIGFSLWVWASNLISVFGHRLDTLIIGRLLGGAAVGIFAIGAEVGALPCTELVAPLHRALFSSFSEANRSGPGASSLYLRVLAATLASTLPAGIGISLTADPLIRLTLGQQWMSAVPLVEILALAWPLTVPAYVADALFNAEGKPHLNFYFGALTTAIKIPLFVTLVFFFGLIGGAIALALSIVAQQVLYLSAIRRLFGVEVHEIARGIWRCLLAAAIMAGMLAVFGFGWTRTEMGVAEAARHLFVAGVGGALVYVVTALGIWLAQGRPEGVESDILRLIDRRAKVLFSGGLARPK